jgi:hypothetical protein
MRLLRLAIKMKPLKVSSRQQRLSEMRSVGIKLVKLLLVSSPMNVFKRYVVSHRLTVTIWNI